MLTAPVQAVAVTFSHETMTCFTLQINSNLPRKSFLDLKKKKMETVLRMVISLTFSPERAFVFSFRPGKHAKLHQHTSRTNANNKGFRNLKKAT